MLDPAVVEIWFPGNQEALEYNRRLLALTQQKREEFVRDREAREMLGREEKAAAPAQTDVPPEGFVGDQFTRIRLEFQYRGGQFHGRCGSLEQR